MVFNSGVSFGISVWIIPEFPDIFKAKYGIQHIPHITVESRISQPLNNFLGRTFTFEFEDGFYLFPQSDKRNRGFRAWGWYCNIKEINIPQAHMSTHYYDELDEYKNIPTRTLIPPKGEFKGIGYLVDTRSNNPYDWKIIDSFDPKMF
jgi:hypothetical protein